MLGQVCITQKQTVELKLNQKRWMNLSQTSAYGTAVHTSRPTI